MSAFDLHKIEAAKEDVNRAMAMLSLVGAALRLEEDFQDEHVNRPVIVGVPIPSLGEVVDTVVACRSLLNDCWERLALREEVR